MGFELVLSGRRQARRLLDYHRHVVSPVWPDLDKFQQLGKLSKIFGKYLRVSLVFDKMLNLLWQFLEILGKFEVLWVAKLWKMF